MTVEENNDSWQWNVVESSDLTSLCTLCKWAIRLPIGVKTLAIMLSVSSEILKWSVSKMQCYNVRLIIIKKMMHGKLCKKWPEFDSCIDNDDTLCMNVIYIQTLSPQGGSFVMVRKLIPCHNRMTTHSWSDFLILRPVTIIFRASSSRNAH